MREEGERNWPFVGGEGFISRKRGLNVGEKVSGWCWNAWDVPNVCLSVSLFKIELISPSETFRQLKFSLFLWLSFTYVNNNDNSSVYLECASYSPSTVLSTLRVVLARRG